MKKRILSTLLALTLCLGLLPTITLAAGNSYGPDEEGYGHITSEKVIDLGEIEYDGTETAKCGSFTISIENTGTQTLTSAACQPVSNGLRYYLPDISIAPGERANVTIEYSIPEGRAYQAYEDHFHIFFDGIEVAGKPVEDVIQFLPKFTLIEAKSSSDSNSGSGNYGGNVFVDEWGNRYQGVDGLGGTSSGSGTSSDAGTLSPSEAKSQYGISVSPSHVEFDPCFVGDKVDPIIVTITNNGSHDVDLGHRGGVTSDDKTVTVSGYLSRDLAPGESRELKISLNTRRAASGPTVMQAKFLLDGRTWAGTVAGGWGVGKSGTSLNISDFLTVNYDVTALSDVAQGDIAWDVSADAVDFGTVDTYGGGTKIREQTITVTNRGTLPFKLEEELSTDKTDVFSASVSYESYSGYVVKPGGSATVRVQAKGNQGRLGKVENTLQLTAYYPDSREKNTITTDIPLSVKYLYDGGYELLNISDNSYGTVKTSDGVDRGPYSGNARFVAKEGGSVTFVMTPYNPAAYHVSDIKINGESVGTSGMVGNTYTISNIQENYKFEAIFAPGQGPNAKPVGQQPQQPATGAAQPAGWAKAFVDKAITEELLPAELQNAYDQPITRREFCLLSDTLYTKVKGGMAPVDTDLTFTDTSDPAVLRMAASKVVNGVGNDRFDPDGQLTREQAATMLSRLSAALGKPLTDGEPTFGDSGSVAFWAKAAVGQMQTSGVMGGTGSNLFSPQLTYTREQSIITLMRLYDMVE